MFSVAFVGAHPDDIEALAGATIAGGVTRRNVCGTATFNTAPQTALRAQGTAVYFVIITNGNKGCGAQFCQNFTTDQIASCAAALLQPKPPPSSVTHFTCRRQEALAAAASLGVSPSRVRMLGFEDGGLDATA